MQINRIFLSNFRKFENYEVNFEQQNIIIGANAKGKTTIVEAIYYCSFFASFRAVKNEQLIKIGQDIANIEIEVQSKNKTNIIQVGLKKDMQQVYLNHQKIKRIDALGSLNLVFINAKTIDLIDGGPKIRRRFLDMYLSQYDRNYTYLLAKYKKLLKQKIKCLKEDKEVTLTLEVINQQLIELNQVIVQKRQIFLKEIMNYAQPIVKIVSNEADDIVSEYQETQIVNLEKEFQKRKVLWGCHLDDFIIKNSDLDLRHFGSQGQKRTVSMAFLLTQIEIIKKYKEEYPLVIIDDVHLELDAQRQLLLFTMVGQKTQMIYVTTEIEKLPVEVNQNATIIEL